jgi:serine O-acetyltransferase
VFELIRADYRRYDAMFQHRDSVSRIVCATLQYGFLATLVYRFGRWTRRIRPRLLSYPFKLIYVLLQFLIDVLFGINLSTNADIGPGLHIAHFGGIFLHGDMGSNCSVAQGVTVGYKGAGKSTKSPVIGDNVYIGSGASVIGAIQIGNDVVIGANTTVVKDVASGSRVVGAEPRVLPPIT